MPLLQPGDTAPDFAVASHTGETVKLSDYAGRYVVLWFYPKADTPGCTIEGKGFRDRIHKFQETNAVILGVSFDEVAANRAFVDKFSFPFLLLSDVDRDLGQKYGAAESKDTGFAKRVSFLIGPDGIVAKVYEQVSPAEHPDQVLADLDALQR